MPRPELPDVLTRLIRALKLKGIFYASFKRGAHERREDDRYFNDMTPEMVGDILGQFDQLVITDLWLSNDVTGRNVSWVNVLAKRVE